MNVWEFLDQQISKLRERRRSGPNKFIRAWLAFLTMLFDPFFLFTLGCTGVLWWLGQNQTTPLTIGLVQTMLAVTAGVLGGRVANLLSAELDEGRLVARGKVAVRSLKLAFVQSISLENRISSFLRENSKTNVSQEMTTRNLEEIVRDCRMLQEQMQSAIDNWGDIVPGAADIAASIGAVTAAKAASDEAIARAEDLEAKLEAANAAGNAKDQRVRELERAVAIAGEEVAETHAAVKQAQNKLLWDALVRANSTATSSLVWPSKPPHSDSNVPAGHLRPRSLVDLALGRREGPKNGSDDADPTGGNSSP